MKSKEIEYIRGKLRNIRIKNRHGDERAVEDITATVLKLLDGYYEQALAEEKQGY